MLLRQRKSGAMAAYLLDGWAVDAILALVAIEGFVVAAWRVRTGGGPPIATTMASLLAGACLLLALREALTGASPQAIAAWLAVSFAAHGGDLVASPEDLRRLPRTQLQSLADELRRETIDAVSITGGHLGAGLGVVELTVALHYVFDTPRDRLIWDVGHQAYPHKILTGRRSRIRTLRQCGGLSGFTKRSESEYDPFGAAHSSTSISASLGMAVARDLSGGTNNVIAVIG